MCALKSRRQQRSRRLAARNMSNTKEREFSGIEVVHELPSDLHSSQNNETRTDLSSGFVLGNVDLPNTAPGADPPAQDNQRPLKRTILWLGGAVVLLIVLAIVLGAVLGTELHRKSRAPSLTNTSSNLTNSSSTPPPSPTTARKGTAISVTGWRSGSEFSIRLFYQGNDEYLRIIGFESSNSSWSVPATFVQAKPGTPIAALSFNTAVQWPGAASVRNLARNYWKGHIY
jgi:Fungal fucose-specific lectin